jgi:hypothetical protein
MPLFYCDLSGFCRTIIREFTFAQHLRFKLIKFALVPSLLITVLKFQNLPCWYRSALQLLFRCVLFK